MSNEGFFLINAGLVPLPQDLARRSQETPKKPHPYHRIVIQTNCGLMPRPRRIPSRLGTDGGLALQEVCPTRHRPFRSRALTSWLLRAAQKFSGPQLAGEPAGAFAPSIPVS